MVLEGFARSFALLAFFEAAKLQRISHGSMPADWERSDRGSL
jgi:hypothetical protein